MHRATSTAAIAVVIASTVGCGGYGYETRSTEISGVTTITSGPGVGERELSRSTSAVSEQLALGVCAREARCGRAHSGACVTQMSARARVELSSWDCDPASIRARAEECLAGIDELTCELDLSSVDNVCPANDTCARYDAELIAPGPALAGVWR